MAAPEARQCQYMWADAGLVGLQHFASLNPVRWSRVMKINTLVKELEALGTSRPLRLQMTSEDEEIRADFDSVQEVLAWLRQHFPREVAETPADAPGWTLFGDCLKPSVAEPEFEVLPSDEPSPSSSSSSSRSSPEPATAPPEPETPEPGCRGLVEGEAQVQYMWADARILPIKAIQELSRHNPARWSKVYAPLKLADELDAMETMRPVLLYVTSQRGYLQRRFHSARAAAQWLRHSGLAVPVNDVQRLDEERLCVICLTAPRDVMLMPCRHAVLCEQCLEVLLQRSPSTCPVCRRRIQNHARGHFVDDYVELVRALEMRMERSQMAAYEGMYNHIRPLMVTGALLATGAAACFVVCPPAAPALLAGAGVVGYLPWFATTVANFEDEPVEDRAQRIFTAEDWANPLALALKGAVLLVAAPVALAVFFIPYGLYAGVLRPGARLLGRAALHAACAFHVYVLRPLPGLLQMLLDGTVAVANLVGDVLGVTAEAFYNWILSPCWSGLTWAGHGLAAAGAWIYQNALAPLGRALHGCGTAMWQGMEVAGRNLYEKVLAPAGRLLARSAELIYGSVLVPAASASWTALKLVGGAVALTAKGFWDYVLVPSAGATWEGLKMLGRGLSFAAEQTYGWVLLPMASATWEGMKMLGTGLSVAGQATYEWVLRPVAGAVIGIAYLSTTGLWNYVLVPVASTTWNGFKMLGGALAVAASASYQYVLQPLAGALYSYVCVPVGRGVSALALGTVYAAQCVFGAAASAAVSIVNGMSWLASASYQYVLVPMGTAAADVGRATYSYVLVPCGNACVVTGRFLVQVVTAAGDTVYLHVLCPVGRLSRAAVEAVSHAAVQGGRVVRVACEGLRRAF